MEVDSPSLIELMKQKELELQQRRLKLMDEEIQRALDKLRRKALSSVRTPIRLEFTFLSLQLFNFANSVG